jgi:hypothetical protein
MGGETNEQSASSSHPTPNPTLGLSQLSASNSTSNIAGSISTSTGIWPNKKADYELLDAIGVGATATVYKVSD